MERGHLKRRWKKAILQVHSKSMRGKTKSFSNRNFPKPRERKKETNKQTLPRGQWNTRTSYPERLWGTQSPQPERLRTWLEKALSSLVELAQLCAGSWTRHSLKVPSKLTYSVFNSWIVSRAFPVGSLTLLLLTHQSTECFWKIPSPSINNIWL